MKDFFLQKRYTYNKSKKAFEIDIPLDFYRDMYNEWDFSPLKKRDLDNDLHDYLLDCADELPLHSRAIINFYLPKKVRDAEKERISRVVYKNYYTYCIHKTKLEKKRLIKQIIAYLLWGGFFLVAGYLLGYFVTKVFLLSLVPEGLFIGGWVLFWEAFSIIFFKASRLTQLVKEYNWLKEGTINFIYLLEENF